MKHLFKIAGLCLASMFVMGMALTTTASATNPVWEQCSEGTENVLPTKYTEHQCTAAAASNKGKWQWNEIKGTEEVTGIGTLRLTDTKAPLGGTAVQCSGKQEGGVVGPGKLDIVTKVKAESCEFVKKGGCESLVENAKAVDLPWQTELFETEGKPFDKIREDGAGQPGWLVKCVSILGKTEEDTCLTEAGKEETTEMVNKRTNLILLVLSIFTGKQKAHCSIGGTGSGEVKGEIGIFKSNGWGLRVS